MFKSSIRIRPATTNDIEPLRILSTKIFETINSRCDKDIIPKYSQTEDGLRWMTKLVERKDDGCCFVAESNGKLIGHVSGQKLEQFYRKSRWFEIDNIGVIAEARGQGVGKQLMDKVLNWAREHGFQKVHIICYAANKEACGFYEREGFSQVDVTYEKDIT